MPLNVITPSEPKDPSLIFKYKKKEEYSGELEGIIVLCFLAIFFAVIFKVIEVIFVVIFILLSIYLTARNGEMNLLSVLPLLMMLMTTSAMTWFQQKNMAKRQSSNN
ncbi:hypothetical protein PGSY75_1221200 [Plasmodium gaboni]|uniref:Uncharacterized protein n=1 Tax=Plasmodium gaboni TaxID=647221 RepID=A0A151LGI6_9APIC|nr:hypothetical protein PGSY75_1221200 [Plasmodium gaboni]XP_028539380.1 conserved Plasmodium protein, unknown function [Plasmodium sp. gorilla clade G2]KYN98016.1 hypothetical protein PGSY75_1221200 [Plasmodium gaboni]SOV16853.1 conserved Plasmodium protein, unknown function [Plasmodium sp. gorilla clade G2]